MIFTSVKIRERKFFFWSNPKIHEFHCVKDRKFKEIKKSKNPSSSRVKIWERNSFLKKSKNPLIPLCGSLKIWENKRNPKILDLNKCDDLGNNFFFKKIQKSFIFKSVKIWKRKLFLKKIQKSLNYSCVKVGKFWKIKKIQKSLIFTSVKIQKRKFFLKKIQKSLNYSCVKVWKFKKIKKSKNPWSSQVWKSGKEIMFWKDPKIL